VTGEGERRRAAGEVSRAEMMRADWAPGFVIEDEARRAALAKQLFVHLRDDDLERVAFFHSRFFSISIATISGVPLDPYTLIDFHRAIDQVAAMIPLSGWTLPALRMRAVLHSTIGGRSPGLTLNAYHFDPSEEHGQRGNGTVPARRVIAEELRRRIGTVLPRGRQSEPRLLEVEARRRLRGG